jgi:alkylation response protein AidB-like acyl-CoA dehydrogenase
MNFGIDDDDRLINDSISVFAVELLRPHARSAEAERCPVDRVRTTFAELGFEALDLPEVVGGAGRGMLTRARVNRTLGKADAGAALALDRLGPATYVLQAFGGPDAVAQFAGPLLAAGGQRIVLLIEQADRELAANERIVGSVPWVPTDRADLVVGLGPTSAWVLRGPASVEPVPGSGLLAAGASRVSFDGLVAAVWTDPEAAARALAKVRLYYASLLVGVLYDSTEFSRAYALERMAFGKPVAHHQGMAFMIVDLFTAVEQVRLLIEDAARRIDDGVDARQHAAAAFVEAIDASRYVGPNGVQILGGHGFMRDYPVEKAMRESRALGLLAGGVERARDDASTLALQINDTFVGA